MCGRFAFYSPDEAITQLFALDAAAPVLPRYNLAPTQFVPAVRDGEAGRALSLLYWGLVPFWAKDRKIGNRMINARGETLAEKPSFRNAFKKRRCLVVADGFYEWQKTDDGKVPHFIAARDGQPFAMAGLWESWKPKDPKDLPGEVSPEDGEPAPLESCTIVTTTANDFMRPLHHRMPVILSADDYAAWLDPGNHDTDALATLLVPAPDDLLDARPVSKRVNSPTNEGPELIEPAG